MKWLKNIYRFKNSTTDVQGRRRTRDTENLTNAQYNFLKAIGEGVHTGLSSKEVMNKYQLGTSANVLKIKKALIQKELIDDQTGIYFLDPVYELFKKNMLHQKIGI